MDFTLDHYMARKQRLYEKADKIKQILTVRNDRDMAERITQLIKNVENEPFTLTVIGEFSKGKSTFLNSLFGKRLLPSKVTPTTALLNKIVYQSKEKITVVEEGKARDITEEDFRKMVAPKEPVVTDKKAVQAFQKHLKKLKRISLVTIGYPLPFLKEGVCIYDTPGFNDLDENRSRLTNTIIPKSDAVIFMLSARKQLSLSERTFLEDRVLSQDLGKLFFIINFKDELTSEQDVERVRQEILDHLPAKIKQPKLFFVSAKYALNFRREQNGEVIRTSKWALRNAPLVQTIDDTGIPQFEQELERFLEEDSGNVKLLHANLQLNHWVDQIVNRNIPLEIYSFNRRITDADQKRNELKRHLDHARVTKSELMERINSDSKVRFKILKKEYESRLEEIKQTAIEEARNHSDDREGMAEAVNVKISPLEGRLEEDLMTWRTAWLQDVIQQCTQQIGPDLLNSYKALIDSFTANAQDKVADKPAISPDSFTMIFYQKDGVIGSGIMTVVKNALEAIWKGIGYSLGIMDQRQDLLRQLENQFKNSMSKKLQRFAAEWKEMQKQLQEKINSDLERELKRTQDIFETMMKNTVLSRDQSEQKIKKLEEQMAALRACEKMNPIADDGESENSGESTRVSEGNH